MMTELASPTMTPQPPPPPPAAFKLPMLYYGLIVVGTAAVVLTVYNLIVIKWCANVVNDRPGQRRRGFVEVTRRRSGRSLDNPNRNLLSSFSYKKNKDIGDKDIIGRTSDHECAVCLSVFEDGEEVRKLPRCNHSFHAPCIDMWLYSHWDCPLCRTPVIEPRFHPPEAEDNSAEHSREGLIGSAVSV